MAEADNNPIPPQKRCSQTVGTVHDELIRAMLGQTRSTLVISGSTFVLCYYILQSTVPNMDFSLWLIAIGVVFFGRGVLLISSRYVKPSLKLTYLYNFFAALTGSLWGGLSLYWSPDFPLEAQLVLFLFPLAMSVGAVSAYGAWLPTFYSFVIPAQLPILVVLMTTGNAFLIQLCAGAVLFFFAQLALVISYHRQIKESIELKLTNQQLVAYLSVQNTELEKKRDEALEASKAKGEFLARMSHEIRTPLNGVLGMAELLSKTQIDAHQQRLVSTVRSSGKILLLLINDLLDMAKIESGKFELDSHDYSMRELVESVVMSLQSLSDEKQIALRAEVTDDVPEWLWGDSLRLRQILINLTGNAIKFTPHGEVSISVLVKLPEVVPLNDKNQPYDENQPWLYVCVKDTGVGIAPERIDAIFDVFSQADGSITRRFGGSGLGLSISKDMVELMGGEICVQSTVNVGSAFSFSVPLQEGTPVLEHELEQSDEVVSPSTENSVIRALVAEDNPVNQMVISAMLEAEHCEVVIADDGEEALQAVQETDFDIVFMDCQMPVLDGFNATKAMRLLGYQLPIIAVTANASAGDREACLEAGMNDYVSKPFDSEALQQVLSRWVANQQSLDKAA